MPRQNKSKIAKALFASSSILTLLAAASGTAYATGNGGAPAAPAFAELNNNTGSESENLNASLTPQEQLNEALNKRRSEFGGHDDSDDEDIDMNSSFYRKNEDRGKLYDKLDEANRELENKRKAELEEQAKGTGSDAVRAQAMLRVMKKNSEEELKRNEKLKNVSSDPIGNMANNPALKHFFNFNQEEEKQEPHNPLKDSFYGGDEGVATLLGNISNNSSTSNTNGGEEKEDDSNSNSGDNSPEPINTETAKENLVAAEEKEGDKLINDANSPKKGKSMLLTRQLPKPPIKNSPVANNTTPTKGSKLQEYQKGLEAKKKEEEDKREAARKKREQDAQDLVNQKKEETKKEELPKVQILADKVKERQKLKAKQDDEAAKRQAEEIKDKSDAGIEKNAEDSMAKILAEQAVENNNLEQEVAERLRQKEETKDKVYITKKELDQAEEKHVKAGKDFDQAMGNLENARKNPQDQETLRTTQQAAIESEMNLHETGVIFSEAEKRFNKLDNAEKEARLKETEAKVKEHLAKAQQKVQEVFAKIGDEQKAEKEKLDQEKKERKAKKAEEAKKRDEEAAERKRIEQEDLAQTTAKVKRLEQESKKLKAQMAAQNKTPEISNEFNSKIPGSSSTSPTSAKENNKPLPKAEAEEENPLALKKLSKEEKAQHRIARAEKAYKAAQKKTIAAENAYSEAEKALKNAKAQDKGTLDEAEKLAANNVFKLAKKEEAAEKKLKNLIAAEQKRLEKEKTLLNGYDSDISGNPSTLPTSAIMNDTADKISKKEDSVVQQEAKHKLAEAKKEIAEARKELAEARKEEDKAGQDCKRAQIAIKNSQNEEELKKAQEVAHKAGMTLLAAGFKLDKAELKVENLVAAFRQNSVSAGLAARKVSFNPEVEIHPIPKENTGRPIRKRSVDQGDNNAQILADQAPAAQDTQNSVPQSKSKYYDIGKAMVELEDQKLRRQEQREMDRADKDAAPADSISQTQVKDDADSKKSKKLAYLEAQIKAEEDIIKALKAKRDAKNNFASAAPIVQDNADRERSDKLAYLKAQIKAEEDIIKALEAKRDAKNNSIPVVAQASTVSGGTSTKEQEAYAFLKAEKNNKQSKLNEINKNLAEQKNAKQRAKLIKAQRILERELKKLAESISIADQHNQQGQTPASAAKANSTVPQDHQDLDNHNIKRETTKKERPLPPLPRRNDGRPGKPIATDPNAPELPPRPGAADNKAQAAPAAPAQAEVPQVQVDAQAAPAAPAQAEVPQVQVDAQAAPAAPAQAVVNQIQVAAQAADNNGLSSSSEAVKNRTMPNPGVDQLVYKSITPLINTRMDVVGMAAGDEDSNIPVGAWISGLYGTSTKGTKNTDSGYKATLTGGSVGLDFEIKDNTILGFAYSYVDSSFKYKSLNNGDKVSGKTNVASIYGLTDFGNNVVWQGILSASFSEIKNLRIEHLNNKIATAKFKSNSYVVDNNLGYKFNINDNVSITPNVGLRYGYYTDGSYKEVGADDWSESVKRKNNSEFTGILGTKLTLLKELDNGVKLIPTLHASVENTFNNKQQKVKAKLASMNDYFENKLGKFDAASFNLGGNILAKRNNFELSIAYAGKFSKNFSNQQGSVKLKIKL